ncbi:MAG: ribonuclease HII [Deltaproteobacteria bacterium]|nr:ribonuclease HII [Deltaproteobacteria bacterium]
MKLTKLRRRLPASQKSGQPRDLFFFEGQCYRQGFRFVAGLDEAGRGCLAGPVVAAAVVFPPYLTIAGVDDSKKLSPQKREELYPQILEKAIAWGVGVVGPDEIDRMNILEASKKAMELALGYLKVPPDHLLIDGNFRITSAYPQTQIIRGDSLSFSIAAASIIAKVTRDRTMVEWQERYPQFQFSRHKGYGTKIHLKEIRTYGLTELHRKSFAPCRQISMGESPLLSISTF